MKSTGNDIVALKFTNRQRSSQPAFYTKFITVTELELHPAGVTIEEFVWLLWSVKESAYKFLKRTHADLVFSPSKIILQNIQLLTNAPVTQFEADGWERGVTETFYSGSVQHQDQTIYFLSIIHNEFIATVVNEESRFEYVHWGVQMIDDSNSDSQSKSVRYFALNKLSKLLNISYLKFEKATAGYPVLMNGGKQMDAPVSFAHHGNYVSYSFVY